MKFTLVKDVNGAMWEEYLKVARLKNNNYKKTIRPAC